MFVPRGAGIERVRLLKENAIRLGSCSKKTYHEISATILSCFFLN
jgi:hypothetical protein